MDSHAISTVIASGTTAGATSTARQKGRRLSVTRRILLAASIELGVAGAVAQLVRQYRCVDRRRNGAPQQAVWYRQRQCVSLDELRCRNQGGGNDKCNQEPEEIEREAHETSRWTIYCTTANRAV